MCYLSIDSYLSIYLLHVLYRGTNMEFLQYLCLIFQRKIIAKTAKEGWKIQPAYRPGLSI